MSFDVYDKNKLIGMVQIDDYERVIYCEDCTCYRAYDGYCYHHGSIVNEHDYCSMAERKDEEE